jgi:hypothetical protein
MEGPARLPRRVLERSSHTGSHFHAMDRDLPRPDDGYDDSVILHEFGHYALDYSGRIRAGSSTERQQPGPAALLERRACHLFPGPGARVSRGSLPGLVRGYPRHLGPGQPSFLPSLECPEHAVRGAEARSWCSAPLGHRGWPEHLWGPESSGTTMFSNSFRGFLEVMVGPMRTASTVTLEDFWDGWFSRGGQRPASGDGSRLRRSRGGVLSRPRGDDAAGGVPFPPTAWRVPHRTFYPSEMRIVSTSSWRRGCGPGRRPASRATEHRSGGHRTESTWTNDDWIHGRRSPRCAS